MSYQFKLDEKTFIPIATFYLFGIGAVKILLFGEHYHLAVNNYINFSNLLEHTFDVLRSLLYFSVPVVAFILWKDGLIPKLMKPITVCISVAIFCISASIFIYSYYCVTITYCASLWLKGLLEMGVFCAGIVIVKYKLVRNFELVKFAFLICFLYIFLKVDNKFTIYSIDKGKDRVSQIVLKADGIKESTICTNGGFYIILNTADFVFLYNDTTQSVTTIPMTNIYSFTYSISDTTKMCK
jgi:hypothetical protein